MPDWQGSGMSVMEISHRSKAFIAVAEQAEADLRELLGIRDDYAVMFLQGGATLQFALLPMNLSPAGATVDYLVTGSWSKKAAKEAGVIRHVNVVADGGESNYTDVPDAGTWQLDPVPRTFTTRRTRRSAASRFTSRRTSAPCRSSRTCRRRSCRGRSTSAASARSTPARRKTSGRPG